LHDQWLTGSLTNSGAVGLARSREASVGTLPPVFADAFRLPREDLCNHLEEADSLANQDNEWSTADSETVRELINDLLLVIRGLMFEHKLQTNGDCRTCAAVWPCPMITSIHAFVKDPERQFVTLAHRARDW
jgi:hypothetical protein